MNTKKFNLTILVLMVVMIGVTACVPPVEKKVWDIIWPPPPEEPRIKYVEILQSSLDVEEPSGMIKFLLGTDVVHVLRKPYGVAVDKDGRVYVTDIGRVFVFDKKNRKFSFIGAEQGAGRLRSPIGITISQDGRVYVSDTTSDRVFVYNSKGKFMTAIGHKGEFESPSGLAIDEKRGRLYIVDAKKHNVKAYKFDGGLLMTIGERGSDVGKFNFPTNIAVDSAGNFYVVDTGNFRVQVFDPDGKHIRTIGRIGDMPGNFAMPKGIAIDSEDNFYVVDAAFQNFQIFNKEGQLLLFVGEGGINPGQFSMPAGIFIDDKDRIYVVEQLTRRVHVFQYLSEKYKKGIAAAEKAEGESGKAAELEKTTDVKEEKKAGEY